MQQLELSCSFLLLGQYLENSIIYVKQFAALAERQSRFVIIATRNATAQQNGFDRKRRARC